MQSLSWFSSFPSLVTPFFLKRCAFENATLRYNVTQSTTPFIPRNSFLISIIMSSQHHFLFLIIQYFHVLLSCGHKMGNWSMTNLVAATSRMIIFHHQLSTANIFTPPLLKFLAESSFVETYSCYVKECYIYVMFCNNHHPTFAGVIAILTLVTILSFKPFQLSQSIYAISTPRLSRHLDTHEESIFDILIVSHHIFASHIFILTHTYIK